MSTASRHRRAQVMRAMQGNMFELRCSFGVNELSGTVSLLTRGSSTDAPVFKLLSCISLYVDSLCRLFCSTRTFFNLMVPSTDGSSEKLESNRYSSSPSLCIDSSLSSSLTFSSSLNPTFVSRLMISDRFWIRYMSRIVIFRMRACPSQKEIEANSTSPM